MKPFFKPLQEALHETNPERKVKAVFTLFHAYHKGELEFEAFTPPKTCEAGRPEKPELVPPRQLATRKLHTQEGLWGLWHALAHIEFNAINLALDACIRFQGMPKAFYEDWLLVAKEEAYHFSLLKAHLNAMGADYGDFPAHNGLWEMAKKTAHSVLARMGCVPRLLEARGLDVAPGIMQKLIQAKDNNGAKLLEIIMLDEEKHVTIGNRWYRYACEKEHVCPLETFQALVATFGPDMLKPPFELKARKRSGFQEDELAWFARLNGAS